MTTYTKEELLARKSSTLPTVKNITLTRGLRSKVVEMIRTANPDANVNYDHLVFNLNRSSGTQVITAKVNPDPNISRLYNNPDNVFEFTYNVPGQIESLRLMFDNVSEVYDYDLFEQVKAEFEKLGIYMQIDDYVGRNYGLESDDNLMFAYILFPDQGSGADITDNQHQTRLINPNHEAIFFIREEAADKQDINFGNKDLAYSTSDMYTSNNVPTHLESPTVAYLSEDF